MNKLIETDADYSVARFRARTIDNKKISDDFENLPYLNTAFFWHNMTYNHETLICKKAVYQKYGKHNLKYKTCIDYYWNIQLVLNGCTFCTLDDIMFVARAGGTSTNKNSLPTNATITCYTNVVKDLWDFYPLTNKDCEKMLLEKRFPLEFLEQLKVKINNMGLKNFDYKFFNSLIDSFIHKETCYRILQNKIAKGFINIISYYKIKKNKNKQERLFNYLMRHDLVYLLCKKIVLGH